MELCEFCNEPMAECTRHPAAREAAARKGMTEGDRDLLARSDRCFALASRCSARAMFARSESSRRHYWRRYCALQDEAWRLYTASGRVI